jgi:hypothetical protein
VQKFRQGCRCDGCKEAQRHYRLEWEMQRTLRERGKRRAEGR